VTEALAFLSGTANGLTSPSTLISYSNIVA